MASNSGFHTSDRCRPQSRFKDCLFLMCMTSIVLLFQYLMAVAVTSAPLKSSLWICYVDDTFVIWPHYLAPLKRFHEHLKQQCPSIQFTMETKDDGETELPSWRKGGQERTH